MTSISRPLAIWRRHWRAYIKTWLVNCLPPLCEPIAYLFAFGVGLSPAIRELTYGGQKIEYPVFLVPAMVALAIVMQSYFEGAYLTFIRTRFEKSWQAMLAGPMNFPDVFVGELLWCATKGVIGGTVTGMVGIVWGIYPWWAFVGAFPVIVLGSLLFGSLGMLTAGVIRSIDQVNVPTFLAIIPMLTICGTYFPRDGLPAHVQGILQLIPYSACVDLLRWHLLVPEHPVVMVGYLMLWTGVTAYLAYRALRRKLIL